MKSSAILFGFFLAYQAAFPQLSHNLPEQQKRRIPIEGIFPSSRHLIKQSSAVYPSFVWPVELDLYDRLGVANYADDDPGGGIADYEGGSIAYDGHRGTDIALHSFRLMDRGTKILAAAPGVVSFVSDTAFDRSKAPNFNTGNYISVLHAGGTETFYYHLRKNSATVNLGESVQAGQMLGLIGSSGNSSIPHLHFEAGKESSFVYEWRDPWHGSNQPLPSLWQSQKEYVANHALYFYDLGVTTRSAIDGNVWPTFDQIIDRPRQPLTIGTSEPAMVFWWWRSGRVGDPYTFEILDPSNNVWAWFDDAISSYPNFDWTATWYGVPSGPSGTWTVRIRSGTTILRQTTFNIGASTVYGPRFWPIDGRSFKINGSTQKDTLRVSSLGSAVTYTFLNSPSFVSLSDSVITVGGTSNQTTRSLYFQVRAADGTGQSDTMWYHVVDPSKPVDPAQLVRANVKCFLGGAFNSATNVMTTFLKSGGVLAGHFGNVPIPGLAVDSINIELRNSSTAAASTIRRFQPAWLLADGSIRSFTDTSLSSLAFEIPQGNYYLVVHHRNHLAVMSAASLTLTSAIPAAYDFSIAQSQAYGVAPMNLMGSKYALVPGDTNQSFGVSVSDGTTVTASLNTFGYLLPDINLSGVVSSADVNIIFSNLNKTSQVP